MKMAPNLICHVHKGFVDDENKKKQRSLNSFSQIYEHL